MEIVIKHNTPTPDLFDRIITVLGGGTADPQVKKIVIKDTNGVVLGEAYIDSSMWSYIDPNTYQLQVTVTISTSGTIDHYELQAQDGTVLFTSTEKQGTSVNAGDQLNITWTVQWQNITGYNSNILDAMQILKMIAGLAPLAPIGGVVYYYEGNPVAFDDEPTILTNTTDDFVEVQSDMTLADSTNIDEIYLQDADGSTTILRLGVSGTLPANVDIKVYFSA